MSRQFRKFYYRLAQVLLLTVLCLQAKAGDWIYTVRPGDTLWDLCLEYTTEKSCWKKLGSYNGVDYPPSLAPGTRINFPISWLKQQPVMAEIIFVRGEVFVDGLEHEQNITLGSMTLGEASISDLSEKEVPQNKAITGMTLPLGATVSTGTNSTVSLQFADGSLLVLEEESEIVLDLLSQHGSTGMVDSRIRLLRGSTRSNIKKREPRSNFSVSTPSAVAAVRGTEFNLAVPPQAKLTSLSSVFEGEVEIQQINTKQSKSSLKTVMVARGYGIRVQQGHPLPEPIPLLPAPEMTEYKNYSLPLTLVWQPVVGAESYQLQLFEQNEQDSLITTASTQQHAIDVPNLKNGCYRTRLSAIDKNGLVGMPKIMKFCAERPPAVPSITLAELENKELRLEWQTETQAHATRIELFSDKKLQQAIYRETVSGNSVEYSLEKQNAVYARVCSVGQYGLEGGCVNTDRLGGHSKIWQVLGVFLVATLALL